MCTPDVSERSELPAGGLAIAAEGSALYFLTFGMEVTSLHERIFQIVACL